MFIIAELAGDDSLAAIITYLKDNPNDIIVPTWVITPVEYKDNFQTVKNNYTLFIQYLKAHGYQIEDLQILENNERLWKLLMKQSFISPCIACHLYCHLLRVPLAKQKNAKILTGERNKHNDKIKINQNTLVLNYFENVFQSFGFNFERPLINIENTEEIKNIIIDLPFDTSNKNNYIKCSIKKPPLKEEDLNQQEILQYLKKNLKPIMEEFINEYSM